MRWLTGLWLLALVGCGHSSNDSERRSGGSGGAAGAGGAGGMAGSSPSGGGGSTGGTSQAGGPGCVSPPWPGEECENGVYFCRPDERDFMLCDATLCATCEGFESPQERNGCRCVCNAMSTGVTCERI